MSILCYKRANLIQRLDCSFSGSTRFGFGPLLLTMGMGR